MTLLSPLQASIVSTIGWSLVHSLWLGTVAAICAWIIVSMLRESRAQSRYAVLLCALTAIPAGSIACAMLLQSERIAPSVTARVRETRAPETAWAEPSVEEKLAAMLDSGVGNQKPDTVDMGAEPPVAVTGTTFALVRQRAAYVQPIARRIARWIPWLVCIWMVGVAALTVRLLLSCVALRQLLSSGSPVSEAVAALAATVASRVGLQRATRLVESTLAEVPATIGFFRPIILVPVSMLSSLSTTELESILAHELAHIHRGDFLINAFQTVIEILLFFHPAVWWIARRIRQEREHACDDLAIGVTGNRLQYARALATVAEQTMQNRLAMTANGGQFSMRIRRILGQENPRPSSSLYVLSVGGLATILLGVAFALFHPTQSTADGARNDADGELPVSQRVDPISGTVLGPEGKPLSGVMLHLRRRPFRYHERPIELANVTSGDDGQFAFRDVEVPVIENRHQSSVFPVDLIATKPGYSIRWQRLTNSRTDISIRLKNESPFSGVLKDDAGDLIAGTTIRVRNLMSLNTITKIDVAGGHTPSENGDSFLDISESVACISATTNRDGKFVLRGLPRRVGMTLGVDDNRFVDNVLYAATTEEELPAIPAGALIFPPRAETVDQIMQQRVRASLVPIHTSPAEVTVTRGVHVRIRVLDDRTGDPVPDAAVLPLNRPPSRVPADANGVCDLYRFKPEVELKLSVYPPAASELLGASVVIPLGTGLHVEREIRLKQGAIISGRVVDADSGAGVADATIAFISEAGAAMESRVPTEGTSDQVGVFRLVVPATTGRVVVSRAPAGYLRPPATAGRQPTAQQASSIVTASLQKPMDGVQVAIDRRPEIPIAFVDADGAPLAATADVRIFTSSNSYFSSIEKVDASGKLDVSLLEKSPKAPTAIQILARSADNQLAGFFRTKDVAKLQGRNADPIVLRPTASVRGCVLDKETHAPIPGARVGLSVSYTETGGQGVASFMCDQEGKYRFQDLVPDMQYSIGASADGHLTLNSIHTRFIANQAESHVIDVVLAPEKPKRVAELQPVQAPAVDHLTPDQAYRVLTREYAKAYVQYRKALDSLKFEDDTTPIVSLGEPTPVYSAAFMALAKQNAGSTIELQALKWVCQSRRIAGAEQLHRQLRTEAAARLLNDFGDRKEIADAVANIIYASPDSYDAAQQLMKSPYDEVRGRACFTCAEIVAQRLIDRYRGGHDVLRKEAIALYQEVVDDYFEITRWDDETIGEAAKNKLFELQKLQIGAMAPEIEGVDLSGTTMKLSEFRGKVVVIHYWEQGLSSSSRLKSIAKEYKGKPLVIVGVSTEKDRDKAIAAAEQLDLAIRHWHDPNQTIHARWSGIWPDTHVISHDGRILYRDQRRSPTPLEDVLDQAVTAAGQAAENAGG